MVYLLIRDERKKKCSAYFLHITVMDVFVQCVVGQGNGYLSFEVRKEACCPWQRRKDKLWCLSCHCLCCYYAAFLFLSGILPEKLNTESMLSFLTDLGLLCLQKHASCSALSLQLAFVEVLISWHNYF